MYQFHISRPLLIVMILAGSLLLSCDSGAGSDPDLAGSNDPVENPPVTAEISQAILFEISHVNNAWGYVCRGLYVDSQGYVYTYDHSDQYWNPGNNGFFMEQQLLEKYSHNSVLVDSVTLETLGEMYQQIKPAAEGALSERVNRCNDAGGQLYTAYVVDSRVSKYYPVLVYEAGDWAQKNLSDAAAQLFAWLQTLNDNSYADPACEYPED